MQNVKKYGWFFFFWKNVEKKLKDNTFMYLGFLSQNRRLFFFIILIF
jgi:hypothetical protein